MVDLELEPRFDIIRDDPRFAQPQLEGVPILTADASFDRYAIEVIPA